MGEKKKSIIELLKEDNIVFKDWYKYFSLYINIIKNIKNNSIIKKITVHEYIFFLEALIKANVLISKNEEKHIYYIAIKKLKNDLDLINSLKQVIETNKINKKTKI